MEILPYQAPKSKATMQCDYGGPKDGEIRDCLDIDMTVIVNDWPSPLSDNTNETLLILLLLLLFVGCASIFTRLWNRWKKREMSEDERNPAYMYSWY